MTPAMLERARRLAAEKGVANVSWREGDVAHLPYPDGAFTIVVTRFAVHHFPDPQAVFARDGAGLRAGRPGRRRRHLCLARSRRRRPNSTGSNCCATRRTCAASRSPSCRACSAPPGSASRARSFYRAARHGRKPAGALVPQPRRRQEDHRAVRRLDRRRPPRHPGAPRRRRRSSNTPIRSRSSARKNPEQEGHDGRDQRRLVKAARLAFAGLCQRMDRAGHGARSGAPAAPARHAGGGAVCRATRASRCSMSAPATAR